MKNRIQRQQEAQKRLFDLMCDYPEIQELDTAAILKVAALAKTHATYGVRREEITAELLESIDSPDDLRQLAESGYIGSGRKFLERRRI